MATTTIGSSGDEVEPYDFPVPIVVIASTAKAADAFIEKMYRPALLDGDVTPEQLLEAARQAQEADAAIFEAISAPPPVPTGELTEVLSIGATDDDLDEPERLSMRERVKRAAALLQRPRTAATDIAATERQSESSHASEAQARRFSERHDMPRHKATRRSQTYVGRREKHIRQKAERLGITFEQAERLTPRRKFEP